jgi:hypothetical protein
MAARTNSRNRRAFRYEGFVKPGEMPPMTHIFTSAPSGSQSTNDPFNHYFYIMVEALDRSRLGCHVGLRLDRYEVSRRAFSSLDHGTTLTIRGLEDYQPGVDTRRTENQSRTYGAIDEGKSIYYREIRAGEKKLYPKD